jgi:Mrp family chromosome partitioning ATPase
MGEILEALRRAEEDRSSRELRPRRPVEVAEGPSFPPLPVQERESPTRSPLPAHESQHFHVSVPRNAENRAFGRIALSEGAGPIAETFRHFALKVRNGLAERRARSVVVTSPLRAEGKTTTSCNLAISLASVSGGARVALVDFDLRLPGVARALAVDVHCGIEEVLSGTARLEEARVETDVPDLDLFLVRTPAAKPHELLARPELGALIGELEREYDLVVCDSPPTLLVPDTALLLAHVASFVVVVRSGATRVGAFRQLLSALPAEKMLGSFLNGAPAPRHLSNYDGYYYSGARRNGAPEKDDEE